MANKREWELFEKRIKVDCDLQQIFCIKVPETVRGMFGGIKRGPRLVKSDPDFVLGVDGRFVLFDSKVTQDRLWNLKKYVFRDDKIHQYSSLLRAHTYGNIAGYLVWFKEYRMITWVPIHVLAQCLAAKTPSITPETDGCISQADDEMVRFRELIAMQTNNQSRVLVVNEEES